MRLEWSPWRREIVTYGVSIGSFLLLWQLASASFGVAALFPPPLATFETMLSLIRDGSLFRDATASLARILIGFAIGSVIGVVAGLLIGTSRLIREILDPYVNLLRFISAVAWISVFIVWFGIGEMSKISLIVYATLFTVLLNVAAGVAAVALNKQRAARSFGATPSQIFFQVTVPATVPHMVTGMRLSLANSFLTIVAAEMVQADSGIGFMIMAARYYLAPDIIFSGIFVLGLLGLLSDRLLILAARLCLGRFYLERKSGGEIA